MPSVKNIGQHEMPDPVEHNTGAPPGTRVLSYRDLKPRNPYPYKRYDRIIEIRLTGNMQRYFWSINGRKFSEAQPIVLRYGERARFRFINETTRVQGFDLASQHFQRLPCGSRNSDVALIAHDADQIRKLADALCRHNTQLRQRRAGALANQKLAHLVNHPIRLLRGRLYRDEAHRRAHRGLEPSGT